jgi:ELWxxDGT repeat protein
MGFAARRAGSNLPVLIAGLLAFSGGVSEAAAEARLVKEIRTSSLPQSSLPSGFVGLGDHVYFAADTFSNGTELWRTDGTPEGTQLVRDIHPGREGSDLGTLVPVGDTLFFRADDGQRHQELWKSDGTTAGTVLVKELETFYQDYGPSDLTNFAGKLYFLHPRGSGLWTSDGTEEGTELVAGISRANRLFNTGSQLLVFACCYEIWTSDGTPSGTQRIAQNLPSFVDSWVASVDGVFFFRVHTTPHSMALWKSDGTPAGTSLVAESFPGSTAP